MVRSCSTLCGAELKPPPGRYGLAEGALVKVSCLGGALELEGAAEALREAEGEETAKEVAAAATEETTDAADKVLPIERSVCVSCTGIGILACMDVHHS